MADLEINTFTAHNFRQHCEERLGLRLVEKTESPLMQLLDRVLFFNDRFMTYYTTIGKTIYWPNLASFGTDPYKDVSVLFHEGQHRSDEKSLWALYHLGYLFPQWLALLAFLLPWLAFWLGWPWLLALVLLALAAPIPAPFRTKLELRGFSCNMLLAVWDRGEVTQRHVDYITGQFSGGWYYFMCPSKSYIERRLREIKRDAEKGKMTKWQQEVHDYLFDRKNRRADGSPHGMLDSTDSPTAPG